MSRPGTRVMLFDLANPAPRTRSPRLVQAQRYALAGALGLAAGTYLPAAWRPAPAPGIPMHLREEAPEYRFIKPLVLTRTDKSLFAEQFSALHASLAAVVGAALSEGRASRVSVYYRDMDSGHWTGVGEDAKFYPASILKVAILIAWLRRAAADPGAMDQRLDYQPDEAFRQHYKPVGLLGSPATASALLDAMIIDSDNAAAASLVRGDPRRLAAVVADLRLPPEPVEDADFMSPRAYSVVYRSLYDATYLPRSLSEQALERLTRTRFDRGIVTGVPPGTVVAHKFGEYSTADTGGRVRRELHDCGIVYHPSRPYLLCVMTEGPAFPALESVIAEVSAAAHAYTDLAGAPES